MHAGDRIYFDHAATTPLDPRVAESMQPFCTDVFGNPSSLHREGREADSALQRARREIAALVGAEAQEVVFTGSGTEADNMALIGVWHAFYGQPFHLVTSAIEHPAVLEACRFLEKCGASVSYLPVSAAGMVDPQAVLAAIRPETRLISIMAANNVTGVLQPLAAIAEAAKRRGIIFHTDAVQAFGHVPLDWKSGAITMLTMSGHKLFGPKGTGALIIRQGTPFEPLLHGGGQEGSRRSATENVAGIVGLARAANLAFDEMAAESDRLTHLRQALFAGLQRVYPGTYLIGDAELRLPGHLCVGFAGLEGEAIKLLLDLDDAGVAVSSGSACSSRHAGMPSYVLAAMGFDAVRARGSLRLTLGRFSREADIDRFLEILPATLHRLKPGVSFQSYTGGMP